jgi:hypothetical protein
MLDFAHLLHLLSCEQELGHIPEVLAHSPECLLGVNVGLIPLQEFLCSGDVLSNGLLRQDMLASEKSLLDEFGLNQDRETNW